jgi:hypothetical protein
LRTNPSSRPVALCQSLLFSQKRSKKALASVAGWAKVGKTKGKGWTEQAGQDPMARLGPSEQLDCQFSFKRDFHLRGDNVPFTGTMCAAGASGLKPKLALGPLLAPTQTASPAAHLVPRLHKAILPRSRDPALAIGLASLGPAGHRGESLLVLFGLKSTLSPRAQPVLTQVPEPCSVQRPVGNWFEAPTGWPHRRRRR